MNLYYDSRYPLWYKRPDWFAVLGVSRLYQQRDLRLRYVFWQEGVSPSVIVELLSPGTEDEDLGRTSRGDDDPPTKWEIYEQILRVPYYIVFNRYTDQLRVFTLMSGSYQELDSSPRIWIPTLNIGLGLWQGEYRGLCRQWLRWYDDQGWISTDAEVAEQERQRAKQAQLQLQQIVRNLLQAGMPIDEIVKITGLSQLQIQEIVKS